jgi:serine phosphatase RsbU (regulator of sigma subunit)
MRNDPFENNSIPVQKDDCFYIFSDGFVDQFGGDKGKKFKARNFKELLASNHSKPMAEQCETLNQTIEDWKGNYSQVDDILVIGIRI